MTDRWNILAVVLYMFALPHNVLEYVMTSRSLTKHHHTMLYCSRSITLRVLTDFDVARGWSSE